MFIYPRCHSHICGSASHSPIDVVSLWFSRTKKGMWVTIGTDQQLSTRTWYALMFISLQHLILFSLNTVNKTYHQQCSTFLALIMTAAFVSKDICGWCFFHQLYIATNLYVMMIYRGSPYTERHVSPSDNRFKFRNALISGYCICLIWILSIRLPVIIFKHIADDAFCHIFFLARQKNAEAVGNHPASLTFSPVFSCNYLHNRMPPLT